MSYNARYLNQISRVEHEIGAEGGKFPCEMAFGIPRNS